MRSDAEKYERMIIMYDCGDNTTCDARALAGKQEMPKKHMDTIIDNSMEITDIEHVVTDLEALFIGPSTAKEGKSCDACPPTGILGIAREQNIRLQGILKRLAAIRDLIQ